MGSATDCGAGAAPLAEGPSAAGGRGCRWGDPPGARLPMHRVAPGRHVAPLLRGPPGRSRALAAAASACIALPLRPLLPAPWAAVDHGVGRRAACESRPLLTASVLGSLADAAGSIRGVPGVDGACEVCACPDAGFPAHAPAARAAPQRPDRRDSAPAGGLSCRSCLAPLSPAAPHTRSCITAMHARDDGSAGDGPATSAMCPFHASLRSAVHWRQLATAGVRSRRCFMPAGTRAARPPHPPMHPTAPPPAAGRS